MWIYWDESECRFEIAFYELGVFIGFRDETEDVLKGFRGNCIVVFSYTIINRTPGWRG